MIKDNLCVLRNHRTEENDFSMEHPCDFCDDFVGYVVQIPDTRTYRKVSKEEGLYAVREMQICKTCLTKMIEVLDKNIVENFQNDVDKLKQHQLYETGDKDAPDIILDSNGEVCLSLCKVCGGAESTLPTRCPGRRLTYKEGQLISEGRLDF
jgi:ribosomal protein RSM22 (predicted rRNA methylase)